MKATVTKADKAVKVKVAAKAVRVKAAKAERHPFPKAPFSALSTEHPL